MPAEKFQTNPAAAEGKASAAQPLAQRLLVWGQHAWRPAATVVAGFLAVLLTVHVVNGAHGLQFWRQKRAEDVQLRNEIQQLQDENDRLRNRIDKLRNDPDAIEHEVREKLHYARPGEIIYTESKPIPSQPPSGAAPAR
jgi:cell division protein FtsB